MLLKKIGILSTVALASVFAACQRDNFEPVIQQDFELVDKAFIRFANASSGSARNYIYRDNVPLPGAATAYGALFPSSAGYYAAVPAGPSTFTIRDTSSTTVQPAVSVTGTFDAGKRYTIFTYDTAYLVKHLTVEDQIEMPADTTARLRFVNIPFSSSSVPDIDIYSKNRAQNIFSNISATGVTEFIPFESGKADTLYAFRAGSQADTLATLTSFTASQKRSYTLVFRGNFDRLSRTLATFLTY